MPSFWIISTFSRPIHSLILLLSCLFLLTMISFLKATINMRICLSPYVVLFHYLEIGWTRLGVQPSLSRSIKSPQLWKEVDRNIMACCRLLNTAWSIFLAGNHGYKSYQERAGGAHMFAICLPMESILFLQLSVLGWLTTSRWPYRITLLRTTLYWTEGLLPILL